MSNTIYESLYHISKGHELVMDTISHDVRVRKRLKRFDTKVFGFLKENHNTHIPKIIDFYEDGDELVVIEEYIQGRTFDSVVRSTTMSEKEKASLFEQVCDGLSFLHNAPSPIIHRDLKPSNIMVTENRQVKIIDYDTAKIYKEGLSKDTVLIGTEGMAAPEQYGFMQSDARTDIYALGILMKEAFKENSRYYKIALKASSFSPEDRYQSADEVKKALGEAGRNGLRSLFPPPGFRTHNPYKMAVAVIGYSFMIFLSITVSAKDGTVYDDILYRVAFLLSSFITVDIFCSWTKAFDGLYGVQDPNVIKKFAARFLYSLFMFAVCIIISALTAGTIEFLTR